MLCHQGYFTSRPAFKRYVRASSAFLNSARQILAVAALKGAAGALVRAPDAVGKTTWATSPSDTDHRLQLLLRVAAGVAMCLAAPSRRVSGASCCGRK